MPPAVADRRRAGELRGDLSELWDAEPGADVDCGKLTWHGELTR